MIKRVLISVLLLVSGISPFAQSADKIITLEEVTRIEKELSADDMQGRGTFTPAIDKAAEYIASEFDKAGIKPLPAGTYLQEFSLLRVRFRSAGGVINGQEIAPANIAALSIQPELDMNERSGYEVMHVGPADTLYRVVSRLLEKDGNYLLVVDSAHKARFGNLRGIRQSTFPYKANIVAVLGTAKPAAYSIRYRQEISQQPLKNVVGILPGKSKKDEFVIFSAHYDHLGIRKPNNAGDSIYNGANDDAAGVTAVIMLARYYAALNNNERTLIFAAFTAEEIGGYGSRYFSEQFDPAKVMAMFNIEMIGTESKWGTNSAFITGYEKTDMGKILEKNLKGSKFRFYPDPYPQQQLFYRSDNATLARLGVPAHTISTSKMDSEKYYHTADDEFETLDMQNMTEIIKAIAVSATSIVAGKDTPSRVDASQLR